ncbi:MAG: hypothetical protein GDA46_02570 [Bdellovibrionales bacterium]|nr:hypothetical protein [Bdellovibrionales bacterium]
MNFKPFLFLLAGSISFFSLQSRANEESSEVQKTQKKEIQEGNKTLDQVKLNQSPGLKSEVERNSKDKKANSNGKKAQLSKSSNIVQEKIENSLKDFLVILETQPFQSKDYINTVTFLKESFYNQVSFESLKLLYKLYEEKGDINNQLKISRIIVINYPKIAEGFYLLGKSYKKLSETIEDPEKFEANKKQIIDSYRQVLKLDTQFSPAYEALLKELMVKDDYTQKLKHTRSSLNLVIDSLRHLKENKYYIPLCEAYYDNKFLRQARIACVKSIRKNPEDPISPLILSFSLSNTKKKKEKILLVANKYMDSFIVQSKVAFYFLRRGDRDLAITYFLRASNLEPENLKLNERLAWLLFNQDREEEALAYFFKTCFMTDTQFLSDFKRAKEALKNKGKSDLSVEFGKGIQECYRKVQEKKEDKAKR